MERVEPTILSQLCDLFRTFGYSGVTLSKITESTRLVKASLYHRFPRGKEEMAEKVLDFADLEFSTSVLQPLQTKGDLQERIQETGKRLQAFYDHGRRSCLLDTLSLHDASHGVRGHARRSYEYWHANFQRVAQEAGFPRKEARQRAEDAIAAIEGALILVRISGDHRPFTRAIESLPDRLSTRSTR